MRSRNGTQTYSNHTQKPQNKQTQRRYINTHRIPVDKENTIKQQTRKKLVDKENTIKQQTRKKLTQTHKQHSSTSKHRHTNKSHVQANQDLRQQTQF